MKWLMVAGLALSSACSNQQTHLLKAEDKAKIKADYRVIKMALDPQYAAVIEELRSNSENCPGLLQLSSVKEVYGDLTLIGMNIECKNFEGSGPFGAIVGEFRLTPDETVLQGVFQKVRHLEGKDISIKSSQLRSALISTQFLIAVQEARKLVSPNVRLSLGDIRSDSNFLSLEMIASIPDPYNSVWEILGNVIVQYNEFTPGPGDADLEVKEAVFQPK